MATPSQPCDAMRPPLVSFVIPVLNGANDIARCVRSIRQQDVPPEDYEVVVMDNGSTDQTHQILRDLACPFQVVPKVNVSTLRNRGAALARGRYLAFVDADVALGPTWLPGGLQALAQPGVVATGSFLEVPEEATWLQQAWSLHQRSRYLDDAVTTVPWLGSANLMVHRKAFLDLGGFNESLITAEDVDLCYRLGQHGVILYNTAMRATHWGGGA